MSASDPTAAVQPAPLTAERPHSQARAAMWLTLRRVTVLAALTDAGYFLLFWAIGSPVLQWINLVSIALYGLAWRLSRDRLHPASVWLMWIEVLGHAALGSLVIGWASGFHYFLMMFIPGIAASTRPRRAVPAIVLLLTFYIGLERLCSAVGPLQPVSPLSLDIVHALNVSIVFAIFAAITMAYVGLMRAAQRRLEDMATRDPSPGCPTVATSGRRPSNGRRRDQGWSPWFCCWWMWTTSRTSTIRTATPWATRCW